MTEEEWRSSTSPGLILDQVKRLLRLPPKVAGRKFRLAAVALARQYPGFDGLPELKATTEAVERICDGLPRPEDRSFTPRTPTSAVNPVPSGDVRRLLDSLLAIEAYAAAAGSAGVVRWASGLAVTAPYITSGPGAEGGPVARAQVEIVRDVFGNPFRPVEIDPSWWTSTAVGVARGMYESRDFGAMPILADALEDAGCDSADVLAHCRGIGPHVRGCWVVDLVLGKT